MTSTTRLVLFCACLLLFTPKNLVKAGFHHGGQDLRELLGGGLLTLLFAGLHGHNSGSGGHNEGRSAAGVPYGHGIPAWMAQAPRHILPHGHGMVIPVPLQAFPGPAYAQALAPRFMHAHGLMGSLPQMHGINPHSLIYGDVNGRSAAYNLGYMSGAIGNNHAFLGMHGLGMHGLEDIYFGNMLKSPFAMQGLEGRSLGSSADNLILPMFQNSNFVSQNGGSSYGPIQNDAKQKSVA